MNYAFNPLRGLIVVQAKVFGPSGSIVLRLALDTGATRTMINVAPLTTIGYDLALALDRVQVTTGSGIEDVPRLLVTQFQALGQTRENFPVLAHTLPRASASAIDGLLGLDFLHGQILTIDFLQGDISLRQPD